MTGPDPIRAFYEDNPRMVSSPFGGIDGINKKRLHAVLERLSISCSGKHVLDVGCGRGYTGEVVRESGGRYTGLDFVLSRAAAGLVQGDARRLPFRDATFDLVFCIDAFEHFPGPSAVTTEFHRVLRPGGMVFLSAPNYANIAGLVKRRLERNGTYRPDTWAPFGRWQPQEFEQCLTPRFVRRVFRAGGFTRFHTVGYGREVYLGLFPWLDHPRMPDQIRLRAQPLLIRLGGPLARLWPSSSLHLFWRIEKQHKRPNRMS